jgi:hypothetical protein
MKLARVLRASLVVALLVSPTVPLFADADPSSSEPIEALAANECLPALAANPVIDQVLEPEPPLFLGSQCGLCVSCENLPDPHDYCRILCQGCGFFIGSCLRDLNLECGPQSGYDPQAKFCFCV